MKRNALKASLLLLLLVLCSVSSFAQFFYIKNQTSTITLKGKEKDVIFVTNLENNAVANFEGNTLAFYFKVSTYSPQTNSTDASMLNDVVAANQFFHLEFTSDFDKSIKLPAVGKSITFNTKGIWNMSNQQLSAVLPVTVRNENGKYFIHVSHVADLRQDLMPTKYKSILTGKLHYELKGELLTELGR